MSGQELRNGVAEQMKLNRLKNYRFYEAKACGIRKKLYFCIEIAISEMAVSVVKMQFYNYL